ncbi:hypothetical protein [Rhizobium sp. SYY.PMSO]|uniref:hypothetical protein n=1 Tax=Rhizobium sp. SYY.PMSO TaxID=3382192 RepID=UPI00399035DA
MARRIGLPGELFLDAVVIDQARALAMSQGESTKEDWANPGRFDPETERRVKNAEPFIALRWVLNPVLGIPLAPFTVWRRPVEKRGPAREISFWRRIAADTYWWDGVSEMLRIELEVSEQVTAYGLSRADHDPVATVTGGPGVIVLEGGPMLGVRVSVPDSVILAKGHSAFFMANEDGWEKVENVGLPIPDELDEASYYHSSGQGPAGAPTTPYDAAIGRLKRWGPVLGWRPLLGLDPWVMPEPQLLVEQFGADLVTDLVGVLDAHRPPHGSDQYRAERAPRPLPEFSQLVADGAYKFGPGSEIERSEIVTRPLQVLTLAVASDTWASLALGFGTGAELGKMTGEPAGYDDFMITAPWHGMMKASVKEPSPWPWSDKTTKLIEQEYDRELVAVVLSPRRRSAPAAPSPLLPASTFVEGAPWPDAQFTSAVKIETPRVKILPGRTQVSGYAIARFDKPQAGQYRLRERPKGGWIPVGAVAPVRAPDQSPDPTQSPDTVTLRDGGVALPFSGSSSNYQYAVAAVDLFGQWSPWGKAWLALGPGNIQTPIITITRAKASPGANNQDPCRLKASAVVVWDATERTCHRMRLVVDVFDPPAPPQPLPEPATTPQPGLARADSMITFDLSGQPTGVPAGVTVTPLQADETPVAPSEAFATREWRYRVEWRDLPIVYGGAREKAVVIYAQAEETVRPGEWPTVWGHAREMVIAPNPLPPPTPTPPPVEYPVWASLPDAAGLSLASVEWQATGAWGYRVFEATEAALRAACGKPGPILTAGYGDRMQYLFDLYADPANHPSLKAAYRKLGEQPIMAPAQPNAKMRYEALLPRGSRLIHCFIVVGISENNVVSEWPNAGTDGRRGFLAYAIPRPLQPPPPELQGTASSGGPPRITVSVAGMRPAASISLYRTAKPILARQTVTMQKVGVAAPDLADWQQRRAADPTARQRAEFTDAGAAPGWQWVQYRAVARYADDRDIAGMAVDSEASHPFDLLYPPSGPPVLNLVEVTDRRTANRAVVRIDTDGPRDGTGIGDHMLAWVVQQATEPLVRGSSPLSGLERFASLDTLLGTANAIGYVGDELYLQLARENGAPLSLSIDLADPMSRATHRVMQLPAYVADVKPVIANLTVARHNTPTDRAVWIGLVCNAPAALNASHDWTLSLRHRPATGLLQTWTTRSVAISTIPVVKTVADVPTPAEFKGAWLATRVGKAGQFVIWVRSTTPLAIAVALTNSTGQSINRQATST